MSKWTSSWPALKASPVVAIPMWLLCYGLFHHVLIVPWPQTVVGDWFPELRANVWLNMF